MATRAAPKTNDRPDPTDPASAKLDQRPSYWSSSIGTKMLIGATGILLVLYLILHLIGNLLIFLGPSTFNGYSDMLLSNPLIYPIEIGLALFFVVHIYKSIANWSKNRSTRPVAYYQAEKRVGGRGWAGGSSRKSIASSTMIVSGTITLLFLIIHLRQFKFGTEYVVRAAGGIEIRDLYRLEMEQLANPATVALYVVAMVLIGLHLWHGASSAFNSVGVDHPRYTPILLRGGRALAIVISGGFIAVTLWVFLVGGGR